MCCPLKVRVMAVSEHKGPQPGLWASGSICISPATLPVLQELPPDRPSFHPETMPSTGLFPG